MLAKSVQGEYFGAKRATGRMKTSLAGAIVMYRPSSNRHMAGFTLRICLLANVLAASCFATEPPDKTVSFQYEDYVLTHQLTACGPVPTALDPNGVYPRQLLRNCQPACSSRYTFIVLKTGSSKLRSPDIGGRATSIVLGIA